MTTRRHLDHGQRRRHRLRNLLQSVLLLGGMVGLLSLCVWVVFGTEGMLWTFGGWVAALLLSPRASPALVLRLYRGRQLRPRDFPQGFAILEPLIRRAELNHVPSFWYLPSPILNAFTLGRRDSAAVAVTDGMIRALNAREFAGVLAHELSHIRNNDIWVMSLADSIGRLTNLMTLAGALLMIVNLPLLLTGRVQFSWLLIFLLLLAPTVANVLQMGLSRAREYDADLEAAMLTGDPAGLASALRKLEMQQAGLWERILMPGRRLPEPSLLRSHPPTQERIRRLMSLYPSKDIVRFDDAGPFGLGDRPAADSRPPRWRITGLWH
ncbi:MAG: M48 family metalloprotease [Rhodospirillales bacterium]|nr:MAG: M48 family metalloprotease [Rhodospirillales bacterium]